jgi:hypothetical protein
VLRELNNPEWRLQHQPAPPIALLVSSSRDEAGPLGIRDTRRFLALVRPPMRVSTIIAPHGGHSFSTWAPELSGAIRWLSAQLTPGQHHGVRLSGPGAPTSRRLSAHVR